MRIAYDFGGLCIDGVNTYLNLRLHDDGMDDKVLMYGINSTINLLLQRRYQNLKKKYLLDLWSPCAMYGLEDVLGNDFHKSIRYFDKVFSICKYTSSWVNKMYGYEKMKYVFYPFNKKIIPSARKKIHDVCFVGGIHSGLHRNRIEIIKNFKYIFVSQMPSSSVTHFNVPNLEKIELMSQSKITICYNILYLKRGQKLNVFKYDDWQKNEAFNNILNGILPQFKSRINLRAICKSLILCKKDPWNVILDFYTSDVDFIYFRDNSLLGLKIRDILKNYEKYEQIVLNAYNKALSYTTLSLMKLVNIS